MKGGAKSDARKGPSQVDKINKRLDNFNFQFNPKMNRNLIFDLATAGWVERREDALFKGPPDPRSYCTTSLTY
jgi:hypothetical protein